MADVDVAVRVFLAKVAEKRRITAAYVFGSFARGTPGKWSDIDVAVVSPDFDDLFEERVELMRLAASVDDRLEPTPFLPESFDPANPLAAEILAHGRRVL